MKINFITLFPELIETHLKYLPFKKAIESGTLAINIVDLRKFALDKYGSVDDKPYGGGKGMLLRIEPVYNALQSLMPQNASIRTILMAPGGRLYNQSIARELTKVEEINILCGRYEGFDERIKNFCDMNLSVGRYVLSGGELPALIVSESVTRLLPGVLDEIATEIESYTDDNAVEVEFPQYTRPEEFMGMRVPDVLLSGNHKEIDKWRKDKIKIISPEDPA